LAIVIFIPISYLAVLIAHLSQLQPIGTTARIHLLAVSITSITTGLLLIFWMLQKSIKRRSLLTVSNLIVIAGIGAFRGAAMYFLAIELEITSSVSLGYRLFNSTTTTLIWLSFISYISNSKRSYHEKYRLLFTQSLLTQTTKITGVELNKELIHVENSLKNLTAFPPGSSITSAQLEQVATAIKTELDDLIRPLSQRLGLSTVQDYPRVKPLRLIIDSITHLKYSPIALIVVISTLNITNYSALMTLSENLFRVVVSIIVISVVYLFFLHLNSRREPIQSLIHFFHLVFLGIFPVRIGEWLSPEDYFDARLPISLIVYLATPMLAISFSALGLIQQDRTRLIQAMAAAESPSGQYHRLQVASYLHNSLQSDLLALSRKLEQAANSTDVNIHRESLEQLSAMLNRSITGDFAEFYESPSERLTKLVNSWSGIISIRIVNPATILVDATKSIIAIQVLEEIASNAAKYSNATELQVKAETDDDFLHLSITANDHYEPSTQVGYGTTFLTAVTKSWSRSANPTNQTEIKIVL
jgi:signal transduction histidine kinase